MNSSQLNSIESHTVIFPGFHLLELEFPRSITEDTLKNALSRIGFQNIVIDQSISNTPVISIQSPKPVIDMWKKWHEWGNPLEQLDSFENPVRYRVIGEISFPIQIRNTESIKWIYVHQLSFNPLEDREKFEFIPFDLEKNTTYDLLFLARMKSKPTKESICETLAILGFIPQKVIATKRNMRIPGRPNTSITRWFAVAKWDGSNSVISSEDPLFFHEVTAVNS